MGANHVRQLIKDRFSGTIDDSAEYGDKLGLNKILSIPQLKKLRLGTSLARGPLVAESDNIAKLLGSPEIGGQLLQSIAGLSMGIGVPMSGKKIAKMQSDAATRQRLQQAGMGTGAGDMIASSGNIVRNVASLARTGFMGSTLMGTTALSGLKAAMSPGMALTSTVGTGGVSGLGAAMGGLAGTAMNPMMLGLAGMMAATKAGKMAYDFSQKNSSTNNQLGRKYTITKGTSPHQLETDYGNTNSLRMQIARMQNMGQLKPGEAIMANILAMIEGHTSVLPLIASESIDAESRRNKEGGGQAHNNLDDIFGSDGAFKSANTGEKRRSILEKIFTGMELGTANLNSTFDIFGQISNTFAGRSSVRMYNEANEKSKLKDPLKAEKQFGAKFGVGVSMVQAIHTTPSQIMSKAETYEAKVLSVMGLHSEISRMSAHELLKIRTDGFGLTGGSSHGYLSTLQEQNAMDEMADIGWYEQYGIKAIDELLGYIPGFNVISGGLKMMNGAKNIYKDFDMESARNPMQVFTDWISSDAKNIVLDNEQDLRQAVGAVEMSTTELMASYLGTAYPDRFELLLEYNLSQMESLEKLAGPIRRSSLENLSMNKYTGKLSTKDEHEEKNQEIRKNMEIELNRLNPVESIWSQWFINKNADQIRDNQKRDAIEGGNTWLAEFDPDEIDSKLDGPRGRTTGRRINRRRSPTAQDSQDEQSSIERREYQLSIAEKQVHLIQEIRDCMGCQGKDYRGKVKRHNDGDDGDTTIIGFGGRGGRNAKKAGFLKKIIKFVKKPKLLLRVLKSASGIAKVTGMLASIIPFLGPAALPIAIAAGSAIAAYGIYKAGEALYDSFMGNDKDDINKANKRIVKERETTKAQKKLEQAALKKKATSEEFLDRISKGFDLKNKSVEELAYLYDRSPDSPPILAAITREMKERKAKGLEIKPGAIPLFTPKKSPDSGPNPNTQQLTGFVAGGGAIGAAIGNVNTNYSGNGAEYSGKITPANSGVNDIGGGVYVPSKYVKGKGMYNSYTGLYGHKATRNNNPGNITGMGGLLYGAHKIATSGTGDRGDQKQLIFDTAEEGWTAMKKLMSSSKYNKRGIAQDFAKWQSDQKMWNKMKQELVRKGVDIRKTFNSLSPHEQLVFMNIRARHEGYQGAAYRGDGMGGVGAVASNTNVSSPAPATVGGGDISQSPQPSANTVIASNATQNDASNPIPSASTLFNKPDTNNAMVEKLMAQLLEASEAQKSIAHTQTRILADISGGVAKDKNNILSLTETGDSSDFSKLKKLLTAHAVNPLT